VTSVPGAPAAGAGLADWLAYIERQHPAEVELGLERVARVAGALGLLPAPVPVVLVGGTNGKGSTLGFLEAALAAAGHRVGAYTSPHFFRFNERVRIGGEPVADAPLAEAFAAVEAARGETPLTYFEFSTLAAMVVFAGQAEVILLEVGLGGRLDAVNIWEPAVSVVTSVALDHQAFLGDDREQIGYEKAGILRPGVPAVCGDPDPPASLAGAGGADLWIQNRDFRAEAREPGQWYWQGPGGEGVGPLPRPALVGAYQLRNAATAVAAGRRLPEGLRPTAADWRTALPAVRIPGRAQYLPGPPAVWLDVAHNPAAAAELARMLAEEPVPGRTLAVFGAMRDKAVAGIRDAMAPVVDRWYPCGVLGERGLAAAEMRTQLQGLPLANGDFPGVAEALAAARSAADPESDRIVVFGSFLMVAAALEVLAPGSPPGSALATPQGGRSS
jgi:dihydrofolate synthase/folylpolyglutamate synthase